MLAPTQVWTLANHVLTTREARRVFGLLAGGAIAGGIFAGFFSKVVAKTFGTETLLLGMAIFLLSCLPLVVIIWRQYQEAVSEAEPVGPSAERPRNLRESVKLVFSSTYLRAIAGLIGISALVTEVIGWQFKAVARSLFPPKIIWQPFWGTSLFMLEFSH